eukprot:PITA_03564
MVVVDKWSKTAHFIPVKSTYKTMEIADIFMKEIFRLHGIPKVVISDPDVKFTSTFWKTFFLGLGTQIQFSRAYHPQTNRQTEWVNQVLEDILDMFVMQQPHKWEDYLHLVEFSYNNGHHESLGMSPFEVLYGRKCRVPVGWNNPVNKFALSPDMLTKMEDVVKKVELEGEFLVEPLHILDWRETTLRKQVITQVKVQWKHFGPDEATWEEEGFM